MFSAPPVVPRPAKEEAGPRRISTCSSSKFSRMLTPGVPNAVDEDVVARIEAADEEAVTEGVAAFARSQGDTSRRPQHFTEGSRVLIFERLLSKNRLRPRRVQDRLGELARGQAIGLVGRVRVCIGVCAGNMPRHLDGLGSATKFEGHSGWRREAERHAGPFEQMLECLLNRKRPGNTG